MLEICLPISIPGPSGLLSIPNLIMSKVYPPIKNSIRIKTMIPTILNPEKANSVHPVVPNAPKILITDAPPIMAPIIPKITYNTNDLTLCNGYTIASPSISPKFHLNS